MSDAPSPKMREGPAAEFPRAELMTGTSPSEPAPSADPPPSGQGWLATLRQRLGLPLAPSLRDTLEDALEGPDSAQFSREERAMLLRLLSFGAKRVADIMVPRADIIALDETASVAELLTLFEASGISRIPLYRETLDDPRGMVHIKDALGWVMGDPVAPAAEAKEPRPARTPIRAPGAKPAQGAPPPKPSERAMSLREPRPFEHLSLSTRDLTRPVQEARIRRPVLYVPDSMPAMNLLIRMQSTRIHMALVVDEYGGTDGLVTIEDLVEQIVGDIEDEHDEADLALITAEGDRDFIAAARAPVADLEARLGLKLLTPEDEAEIETLGGLVFALVGRVPSRGELIKHPSGIEFEVLDADPRRIKKLKIHPPKADSNQT